MAPSAILIICCLFHVRTLLSALSSLPLDDWLPPCSISANALFVGSMNTSVHGGISSDDTVAMMLRFCTLGSLAIKAALPKKAADTIGKGAIVTCHSIHSMRLSRFHCGSIAEMMHYLSFVNEIIDSFDYFVGR